jgi:general secretion pathway protein E/type IV pilus assembly protein PilB
LAGRPLFRRVGCNHCRQVGYSGRIGIYELLITTEDVRQLAHDRASTWKIKQAGMKHGMVTLREDGWRKALGGITTVDEVLRVTRGDQSIEFDR